MDADRPRIGFGRRRPPRGLTAAGALGAVLAVALMGSGCSGAPQLQRNAQQQAALTTSQSAARAWNRGDLAQARTLYERALAAAESVEDFELAGSLLVNLALVHQRAAEREAAEAARTRELGAAHARLDRVIGAPLRYGAPLHAAAALRKAMLHLDASEAEAAKRWTDTAAAACVQPCPHAAALALVRAQLAWQRDDTAGAWRLAEEALAASGGNASPVAEQASALRHRGRAASRLGRPAEAAADLAQALAIDQRLGLPDRIALDLTWAGDAALRRGDAAAAREFYERALVVARAAGLPAAVQRLRERLGPISKP